VSSLAPSAFLVSAAGTRDLQDLILRRTERSADDVFDRCLVSQLSKFPMLPPSGSAAGNIYLYVVFFLAENDNENEN
jgi:hypothetical protein